MSKQSNIKTLAGGVITNNENMVLIVKQKGGSWSLPKGKVDPGETLLQTAIREIYEESNIPESELQLIGSNPIGVYTRNKISGSDGEKPNTPRTLHFFRFTTTYTGDITPIDPHNPEARWVNKEEVSGMLTHPKDKEFFESIIDNI